MSGYTKGWLAWSVVTLSSFAVIEGKALAERNEEGTLSAHLRHAFGFDDQGPVPELRRGVFYAFWGWFGLHILKRTAGDAFPA